MKEIRTFSEPVKVVMMSKSLIENLIFATFGIRIGAPVLLTILQLKVYGPFFPMTSTTILLGDMVNSDVTKTPAEKSTKCWLVSELADILKVGGIIFLHGFATTSHTNPNSR